MEPGDFRSIAREPRPVNRFAAGGAVGLARGRTAVLYFSPTPPSWPQPPLHAWHPHSRNHLPITRHSHVPLTPAPATSSDHITPTSKPRGQPWPRGLVVIVYIHTLYHGVVPWAAQLPPQMCHWRLSPCRLPPLKCPPAPCQRPGRGILLRAGALAAPRASPSLLCCDAHRARGYPNYDSSNQTTRRSRTRDIAYPLVLVVSDPSGYGWAVCTPKMAESWLSFESATGTASLRCDALAAQLPAVIAVSPAASHSTLNLLSPFILHMRKAAGDTAHGAVSRTVRRGPV